MGWNCKTSAKKLEKQVEFLIARYADAILEHPNEESEKKNKVSDW